MDFDSEINRVLNENLFGGPPHQRMAGIRRQVEFIDEDAERDSYTADELKALTDLADAAAKFQSRVDTEALADRGVKLIEFLDTARRIYRAAAGENKLGKVVAGVHRAIADPLSLYILELEYGNLNFNQDVADRIIDSVLPTFLTKKGEFAKGTTEEEVVDVTLEMLDDFRQGLAVFNFAKVNANLEQLHYDKDIDGYRYQYCGKCEGGVTTRVREADPARGIEAEYSTGLGWDHNGFRIEASSSVDVGPRINLYNSLDAFTVVTLVAPHSNPESEPARIVTIKI